MRPEIGSASFVPHSLGRELSAILSSKLWLQICRRQLKWWQGEERIFLGFWLTGIPTSKLVSHPLLYEVLCLVWSEPCTLRCTVTMLNLLKHDFKEEKNKLSNSIKIIVRERNLINIDFLLFAQKKLFFLTIMLFHIFGGMNLHICALFKTHTFFLLPL